MTDNLLKSTLTTKTIQAHLANGHIGLQGSDSGLAAARSFMVGISDLTPNDFYKMALLPTWNEIGIAVNGDTIQTAFERGDAAGYEQVVDMANGALRTTYSVTVGGARLSVGVEAWLSMADRFLAFQAVTITADRDVIAVVSVGIRENPKIERHPFRSIVWPHSDYPREYGQGFTDKRMSYVWHPGDMAVVDVQSQPDALTWAVAATAGGHGPSVGVAIAMRCVGGVTVIDKSTLTTASGELAVSLVGDVPFTVEQYVGFSRDDWPRRLAGNALHVAEAARNAGRAAIWSANADAWAELWRGDIVVEGNEALAKQVRADLYYLYSNAPADPRFPFQIMGVASPGYFGGCFWDCDVYMTPAALPFVADKATNVTRFRKRILPKAMQNASREGYKGAHYSLVSEMVEGEENCLGHSAMALGEIHFTADAAIGAWTAFCVTGDTSFLRLEAWPVIEAVAQYFASRVTWIAWEGRYELLQVHGADEALGNVQNCIFTNSAVRKAMRCAVRAAEIIGISPDPVWAQVAEKLHTPVNKKTGCYQAHSGTDDRSPSGFVETNAVAIADLPANAEQLANIIAAEPHTWDMSLQATVAAQAGNAARMAEYIDYQVTSFAHQGEFLLRTEFPDNDAGPYLCGSGALILNLMLGATGLRFGESGLERRFEPCLPQGVEKVTFTRLSWHGKSYRVTVESTGTSIEPLAD